MSTVKRPRGRVSELLWELGGGTRGRRRRGRQELNNLLCYWLMLHCRHLELIAALFSSPSILICFAVLDLIKAFFFFFNSVSVPRPPPTSLPPSFPSLPVHSIHRYSQLFNSPLQAAVVSVLYVVCVCVCVCVLQVLNLSVTRELHYMWKRKEGLRAKGVCVWGGVKQAGPIFGGLLYLFMGCNGPRRFCGTTCC